MTVIRHSTRQLHDAQFYPYLLRYSYQAVIRPSVYGQCRHLAMTSSAARLSRLLPPATRQSRRSFHDYFVTHLPSSSMQPETRHGLGHKLLQDHLTPHAIPATPAPAIPPNVGIRDLTVVRIPLAKAKHHFGAANSRGDRSYNEDAHQMGTVDMPAFAKKGPISLQKNTVPGMGEATTAPSIYGDPQVFYFGVFDGHGGTQCSQFLRDELHGYIEEAAAKLRLPSSLKKLDKQAPVTLASTDPVMVHDGELDPLPLCKDLVHEYKQAIGGYFRRFVPKFFIDMYHAEPPVVSSIESVLIYAFLRADLDFVRAQERLPDDSVMDDRPLNADEILGVPLHVPPSGHGIGTDVRFKGGSTASIALISTPTPAPFWHPKASASLIVAHVGDTRALLCETATGQAHPLTVDHHPTMPSEERRLRRYAPATSLVSGDSFGEERIAGLANSRAFGDMSSKRIGVSAEPDITRIDMNPGEFSFLVLMSDGISGTLSDQEIVDIIKEARTPDQGAKDLVGYAVEVSGNGDNATAVVVRLGGWERRQEGGVGSIGTKEMRDMRREEAQNPRARRQ